MSKSTGVRATSRNGRARAATQSAVGPWQLVRMIGSGHWTNVFQARPAGSADEAAADYVVKMLKPGFQHDPTAIGLLQREAFVASQVRHFHLKSVLSQHVHKPPIYLVAPYLAGSTACQLLEFAEGRLAVTQSLWIVRQAAEAIRALHRQGWRHGDVKPANILVAKNGHVTLLDLGFAEQIDKTGAGAPLAVSPGYACPESFHDTPELTAQSDIYSLGVTLYELLTGRRPFVDQQPSALAASHLRKPPPDPRTLVPHLPARVRRLLRRMLAKQPLRRPTADELIDWLVELEIDTFEDRLSA